jgi:hypothetical protein
MITSGFRLDEPGFPHESDGGALKKTALMLHKGLAEVLQTQYDLELIEGTWVPGESKGQE